MSNNILLVSFMPWETVSTASSLGSFFLRVSSASREDISVLSIDSINPKDFLSVTSISRPNFSLIVDFILSNSILVKPSFPLRFDIEENFFSSCLYRLDLTSAGIFNLDIATLALFISPDSAIFIIRLTSDLGIPNVGSDKIL